MFTDTLTFELIDKGENMYFVCLFKSQKLSMRPFIHLYHLCFINSSCQIHFGHMSSWGCSSSETSQENLGFGHITAVFTFGLCAVIPQEVHLSTVVSSHVAEISLHRMG